MKVLHCINSLSTYGGAEKIVEKLCSLDDHDYLVIYKEKPENFILEFFLIIRFVIKLISYRKKYDFFHFHLFPAFYCSFVLPSRKVIIHEHNTFNGRRKYSFFKSIEKVLYKRARRVICISESVSESLNHWLGFNENFAILSNFSRFEFKKNLTSNSIVNVYDKFKILMVASFSDQKRQEQLIQALVYLPNKFTVDFLGDGSTLPRCVETAKRLGVSSRVKFHGNVSDVANFYRSTDMCVLLSNWEGFGMVVVEAASFHKVTLGSDVPGLSSVIDNKDLLFNNSENSELLAIKILKIYDNLMVDNNCYYNYCAKLSDMYSFNKYKDNLTKIYFNSAS